MGSAAREQSQKGVERSAAEDDDFPAEMAGLEKIINLLHSGSSKGALAAMMLRFSRWQIG